MALAKVKTLSTGTSWLPHPTPHASVFTTQIRYVLALEYLAVMCGCLDPHVFVFTLPMSTTLQTTVRGCLWRYNARYEAYVHSSPSDHSAWLQPCVVPNLHVPAGREGGKGGGQE